MGKLQSHCWHYESGDDLVQKLNVDPLHGLRDEEAANRRERYGLNRLKRKKAKTHSFCF